MIDVQLLSPKILDSIHLSTFRSQQELLKLDLKFHISQMLSDILCGFTARESMQQMLVTGRVPSLQIEWRMKWLNLSYRSYSDNQS